MIEVGHTFTVAGIPREPLWRRALIALGVAKARPLTVFKVTHVV